MIETLAALLFAHALADFVFQTNWMVRNKRRVKGVALHGLVVLATALAATGSVALSLVWLAAIHMAIDALKARAPQSVGPFLLDQAAHLVSLAALALWQPGLWATGLWAGLTPLPAILLVLAGGILATRAGGFAIGMLMGHFADRLPREVTAESLPGAGRVIGHLPRRLPQRT